MTRLVFTRHAVERYVQFHMLDRDEQRTDWRDVMDELNKHAPEAYKLDVKTRRGHVQYRIDALGCDMVAKHDDGVDVVVTILPPQLLRGLTPEQAERVAESALAATERAAALLAEQKQAVATRKAAAAAARKPPVAVSAPVAVFALEARQKRNERLQALAKERTIADLERDVLCALLKTMRHQLNREANEAKLVAALRIAVRHMRAIGATDVIEQIATIDPGLVSDAFIAGGAT